ncbi:MAG: hypothetical protein AB9891_09550 [Anaerolineaceae bacterium]
MNELTKQSDDIKTPVKNSLPSYRPGWGWIIGVVLVEIIGRIFTGIMANAARSQNTGLGDFLNVMNRLAFIQGLVDLLMVILGIIGIVLLVRTFLIRSKAKKA